MKLVIRWLGVSLSLFVTAKLIHGIVVEPNAWWVYGVMAVILGLLNATLRPLLKLLSCGIIVLTFGLFIFVINGLVFWLASVIAVRLFHVGFRVQGFWPAVISAAVVSGLSLLLNFLLKDEDSDR
jgi:putative membrane protein